MLAKTIDAKIVKMRKSGNLIEQSNGEKGFVVEQLVYGTLPYNIMMDYDTVDDIINDGGNSYYEK